MFLKVHPGAYSGGDLQFFFIGGGGLIVNSGSKKPLETIDFTDPGRGLSLHSPPEYAPEFNPLFEGTLCTNSPVEAQYHPFSIAGCRSGRSHPAKLHFLPPRQTFTIISTSFKQESL